MDKIVWVGVCFLLVFVLTAVADDKRLPNTSSSVAPFGKAVKVGLLESTRLVECSGLEASMVDDDLLWAINDGGHGPFLYAIGQDGRDRGHVRILGAENRDWEGLDIFLWHGRAMILIADFGDNTQRHDTHTLYVVPEPELIGANLHPNAAAETVWRVVFSYPDHPHDAEAVAVDVEGRRILVLTKRDDPPILFALPLRPGPDSGTVVAQRVAAISSIPPPTPDDRLHPYGGVRSRPTAMDLSSNGLRMVVLTYKHAYLFSRLPSDNWDVVVGAQPDVIPLPLPQASRELRQREAICFSMNGQSLFITSEGKGAGLYRLILK